MQNEFGGRGSEFVGNPGAHPLQGAPDPALVDEYVRRCLTVEFTEAPEPRTFRSDPAFAGVLTPLNSQQFAAAITAGQALIPRFPDFDLLYKWVAAGFRSTQQSAQARAVLFAGLANAKRKSLLLTDMGDTEAQSGDLGGAVYWWSQAIHCLSLNPVDCDAWLLLSYVANGYGLADLERPLLERFDSLRTGQVRLDPATAGRLTNLARRSQTESIRRVLDGLQFGYFASSVKRSDAVTPPPPAAAPRELKPVPPPVSGPPPGWYPDPTGAAALCWWDGAQWQPSAGHYPRDGGPSHGPEPRPSDGAAPPPVVVDQTAPVVAAPPAVTELQAVASDRVPQVTPEAPFDPAPPHGTEQQAAASHEVPSVTSAAAASPAPPAIQPPGPKQPMKRWPIIAGVGVLAVAAIVGVVVVPRLSSSDSAAPAPGPVISPPAASAPGVAAGMLAAGYLHTCRVTDAGGVQCWGDNGFGQLGDGTRTDRATPVNVVGLNESVVELSAGGYQTCAVTSAGAVKCWGANDLGQLGDGSTTSSPVPVAVVGLGAGVRSIASGYEHTCVVTTGGAVKCWGANESGQLGDDSTTNRLTPVDVQGLASDVRAATAGGDYGGGQTCALKTNGSVACWGSNRSGQLGDGTTTSQSTPVAVTTLAAGVEAISAGDEHVCALTVGGEVQCWGENLFGQLGNGSPGGQVTPTPVPGLGSGVRALSSGGLHTCVITNASGVLCWGDNEYGQLGDGTTETRSTAVPVAGLTSNVGLVKAGAKSTCALTGAGVEQCWGDNESGQLGNGTTTGSSTPVSVAG